MTNGLIGGWTANSIVTLQSGFPFTPQLSYNPSNNGDTKNPVRPFVNPSFTGKAIVGKPSAVVQSCGISGAAAGQRILWQSGPRLAYRVRDSPSGTSPCSRTRRSHERMRLQLRAEFFNILNHSNFNTPNLVVFTPSGVSPTAGVITSTSTTSRQIQFAAKLLW